MKNIFSKNKFSAVFHLAAQAGVRFSIENPNQYYQSNIKGFYNILDLSREFKINHLFFKLHIDTKAIYQTKEDPDTVITKYKNIYSTHSCIIFKLISNYNKINFLCR